jgi:hypothetical protein
VPTTGRQVFKRSLTLWSGEGRGLALGIHCRDGRGSCRRCTLFCSRPSLLFVRIFFSLLTKFTNWWCVANEAFLVTIVYWSLLANSSTFSTRYSGSYLNLIPVNFNDVVATQRGPMFLCTQWILGSRCLKFFSRILHLPRGVHYPSTSSSSWATSA